jgi:predicted phage baseplate assembly protein
VLEVEQAGGWKRWTEVDGFHASEADAPHYILDREAGTVRFGNGLQGLPPQIGQRIRSVEYRYGGGARGNVAAGAINKLPSVPLVRAGNPLAAVGGAEAESIEQALERIPGELRRRDRAVTADDFRELARMTPGAQVGRAECLPRFHPPTKTGERPGIVSVVVWPAEDRLNPNAPRPDRNLLRSVCEWLDARRLVTTELYVIPPAYRKVAVAVGLQVKDGYGVEAVRRWVELVIRQYLAPLPPYGPAGTGWPLGRRVHGPELEAAALQVEGVEFLEDLKVAGFDEAAQQWVQGTVELALYEVPELTGITVVEGPVTLNPGDAIGAPPPARTPVPIPVIRQVC